MIGDKKLAEMDDAYCRSIGASPGSDSYVQCREFKTAQRDQSHHAAYRRAAAGMAGASASYGNALRQNRPVNCTSTPSSTWVGGPVSSVRTTCY